MKTNLSYSCTSRAIVVIWLMLSPILASCANTVVYQHTTTVKASAEELDVRVLGFVSDIHVKDGMVEVSMTSVLTFGNAIGRVTSNEIRIEADGHGPSGAGLRTTQSRALAYMALHAGADVHRNFYHSSLTPGALRKLLVKPRLVRPRHQRY
jgi:hypothetical protein